MQKNYFSQQAEEVANLGTWEIDLVSHGVIWSDQFYKICGYDPNLVKPSVDLGMAVVHPDDRALTEHVLKQTLESGEDYVIEKRIIRPDGTLRHVYSQAIVEKDDSGTPLRLKGIFFDITDRKNAEEQILLKQQRLELIYSTVNNIIFLINVEDDGRFRLISINDAPGFIKQNLVGQYLETVISAHIWPTISEKLKEAIQTKQTISWEQEGEISDQVKVFIISITPAFNSKGHCFQVVGSAVDITDRKLAETNNRLKDERYYTILNSILEGCQIIDFNFRYVYLNPAAIVQSRFPLDQLLGRTMSEVYPGIEKTSLFKTLKKCMKNRSVDYIENEFEYPDGSKGWFELRIQPSIEGLFVLSMDITEKKNAEALRFKSEKRYRALIENSYEGITLLDKDFKILYRSPSTYKITGWTKKERTDQVNMQEIHPDDVDDIIKGRLAVIDNPSKPVFLSFRAKHKKGHYIWLEAILTNMLANENVEAIVFNFRDVSERKIAEDKIKELNDVLEQKVTERTTQYEAVNKELESFSYSVSHDLRAPLRAIDGYATMIEEDYHAILDEEGKRLLKNVQQNAKKMSFLIDDLLAFSRLGKKEMQKREIDMNELLEGVIIDLNKSSHYKADIQVGKLHKVNADYSLIHQVFMNLVSNALKYSSKKDKPFVKIQSKVENNEIIYSVTDNGVGFDMKYSHKLFGVFQRLHTMDEFEGTGVGLAIVQRVVTRHGGKIWADSKLDEGSVFSFSLPEF